MSADTLTVTSRAFYERTKIKVAASIFISAAALMLLGFCSSSGGLSKSYQLTADEFDDDTTKDANQSLADGYGFAAFVYILGFILMLATAIYISPVICGTNNEKKMANSPQELDSNYAAYTEPQMAKGQV